ncbi:MAG: lipoyl synthase, partial [Candidatus Omnitrophica bacterium]|nr:lipoyl synthase [Candidatus Omnitrophota bacterium]
MNSSPVSAQPARLPPWFRQPVPEPGKISYLKEILQRHRLHTVCESAHCPNMGVCWG